MNLLDNKAILGVAITLFCFTSTWLYSLYLPVLAAAFVIAYTGLIVIRKQANIRFSRILAPLAIILLFVWLRCLFDYTGNAIFNAVFITLTGISMLIIGRRYGICICWGLAALAIIQSISVIIVALFFSDWDTGSGIRNGGLIDQSNYALGQAVIVIGLITGVYLIKSIRWNVCFVYMCVLGLLFTGSPEAFVFLVIACLYAIYHLKLTRTILAGAGIVIIIFAAWMVYGPGMKQYERLGEVTTLVTSGDIANSSTWDDNVIEDRYSWGDARLPLYKQAIEDISMFGHGYAIYNAQTYHKKVHNVPLVVADQIGLIPALAWLGVTLYCLFRTKYKLLWIGIIVLGLFNHTTWTVFAPYWWLAVGITIGGNYDIERNDHKAALC